MQNRIIKEIYGELDGPLTAEQMQQV